MSSIIIVKNGMSSVKYQNAMIMNNSVNDGIIMIMW